MKKALCLLLLLLFTGSAQAETILTLDRSILSAGETVLAQVETAAGEIRYDVLRAGETLVAGEYGAETPAAYRPREAGSYVLRVTARDAGGAEETAEAAFTVVEALTCDVALDRDSARAGDTLTAQAETTGGAAPLRYTWQMQLDGGTYTQTETTAPTCSFAAPQEGALSVAVTVTDAGGASVTASSPILVVAAGPGISVRGDETCFFTQGGAQTWTITAPGAWTAETDADWLTLANDCGQSGGPLTLIAQESGGNARTATLTLRSGDTVAGFPVVQRGDYVEDRELLLFTQAQGEIAVDGREDAVWNEAAGEQVFPVQASGEWTAQSDADYVHAVPGVDALTLRIDENGTGRARGAVVTLRCGTAEARVHVSQLPQTDGPDVLAVQLSAEGGAAWQTILTATVTTSADAERLTLQGCGQDRTWPISQAEETAEGLAWTVSLPLVGSGAQTLLFQAESSRGGGQPMARTVQVTGEGPGFASEGAVLRFSQGKPQVQVLVTTATSEVELLDDSGRTLRLCTRAEASPDAFVSADNAGRYALWTIPLETGELPAQLRIGDQLASVPQDLTAALNPVTPFDQCDGWWSDKAYHKSTLAVSGCAIFALSHALEALGYTGMEVTPEALAKAYAFCLVDGGTLNSTLVGNAGDDLGFRTRYDLFTSKSEVLRRMEMGAVFSFSVVSGHIAMVRGASEDGEMLHIIDSALSATFSRIKDAQLYRRDETGAFVPLSSLAELPGAVYYLETGAYGGGEYWLETSYVLRRGVRLIQPEY